MARKPNPDERQLSESLKEAEENHSYWVRQSILRTEPRAVAQAKALRRAWATTVEARYCALASAKSS